MTRRIQLLAAATTFIAFSACSKDSDLIELRLYPCQLAAEALPMEVEVSINSFDANGSKLGATIEQSFTIANAEIFADDYATLGYRRPKQAVTANIDLTWKLNELERRASYQDLKLPESGGFLELLDASCMMGPDTTTGNESSSSDGSSTTEMQGTSTTTSDSSSNTTSDETTTTTSNSSSDSESESETGMDPESVEPEAGKPCNPEGTYKEDVFCWTPGYGQIGRLLQCQMIMGKWVYKDVLAENCLAIPNEMKGPCGNVELSNDELVGCSGNTSIDSDDLTWACLCKGDQSCDGMESPCAPLPYDPEAFDLLTMCIENKLYRAACPSPPLNPPNPQYQCLTDPMDPTQPICGPITSPLFPLP